MEKKIQALIKLAEVRKSAYTACSKVFNTDKAKYKSIGKLEEVEFFLRELKNIVSDK